MKRKLYTSLVALFVVLLLAVGAHAQLVAWQFSSPASLGTETTYNSFSMAPGVELSTLQRGPGLLPTALARGFSSTVRLWSTTGSTKTDAINDSAYYEFKAKAKAGYTLNIKGIDCILRRSGAGNKNYRWAYSLDGTSFTEVGAADVLDFDATANTNGVVQPRIDLTTVTALQNLTPATTVTFRLYTWGTTSATGTIALGRYAATDLTASLALIGDALPVVAPLVAWQFGNPATLGTETAVKATTVNAGIDTPSLVRGAAFAGSSLPRGFSSNVPVLVSTKTDAVNNGGYYEFTVASKPGVSLSLSGLTARLRRSSNGANAYRWKYSINNGTFYEIGTADTDFTLTADGVTQTEVDLSLVDELQNLPAGATVTFRLYAWGFTTVSAGSFAIGRFAADELNNSLSITGTANSTTPVQLLSFTAQPQGNKVQLLWHTASEVNMQSYEVQKSLSANTFNTIATLKAGAAAGRYTYSDALLANSFYRLKMNNHDGSYTYSNIVAVDTKNTAVVKAYPNPVKQGEVLTLVFETLKQTGNISIFNAAGVMVQQQSIPANASQYMAHVTTLPAGVYTARLYINGAVATLTFIKQ